MEKRGEEEEKPSGVNAKPPPPNFFETVARRGLSEGEGCGEDTNRGN